MAKPKSRIIAGKAELALKTTGDDGDFQQLIHTLQPQLDEAIRSVLEPYMVDLDSYANYSDSAYGIRTPTLRRVRNFQEPKVVKP